MCGIKYRPIKIFLGKWVVIAPEGARVHLKTVDQRIGVHLHISEYSQASLRYPADVTGHWPGRNPRDSGCGYLSIRSTGDLSKSNVQEAQRYA